MCLAYSSEKESIYDFIKTVSEKHDFWTAGLKHTSLRFQQLDIRNDVRRGRNKTRTVATFWGSFHL